MKIEKRNCVSDDLLKYDYLANKDSFIVVTEWSNREGWNITINERVFSLTMGELEAINYLTKTLEYTSENENI